MARKQIRKPAKRKPARSGSAARSSKFKGAGWLAAVAVAGVWGISALAPHGFPLSSWRLTDMRDLLQIPGHRKDVGDLIAEFERTKPSEEREQVATTGSIPTPRKRVQEPPPPHQARFAAIEPPTAVPMPRTAPPMPVAEPVLQVARPEPSPLPAVAIPRPSGVAVGGLAASQGKRHATRNLAAYSTPDAGSSKVAEIESGTSVIVIRSAGGWRLVRDVRTSSEGWVDGRFLAGEAMAADLASYGPPR